MKQFSLVASAAVLTAFASLTPALAEGDGALLPISQMLSHGTPALTLPLAEAPAAAAAGKAGGVRVGSGRVVSGGQSGMASWYALPGRRTACGPIHNPEAMTAAHRSLPCGTKVQVTSRRTGKSVVVTINDRGPFTGGRILDLSRGPARAIGILGSGVGPVQLAVLR